jgi:transcriptional regulator with XRE-family HTH domain
MGSRLHGSELLDRYLRKTGETERGLARRVGIHYSRISRYRSGESTPGTRTAVALDRETAGRVPLRSWMVSAPADDPHAGEGR